ncbi:MAG: hypothetical protein KCHDKBKB_02853 [Elusimicrobia bacterium]|nr:hypothetical protein [Elusimicrobiota bacterium]
MAMLVHIASEMNVKRYLGAPKVCEFEIVLASLKFLMHNPDQIS